MSNKQHTAPTAALQSPSHLETSTAITPAYCSIYCCLEDGVPPSHGPRIYRHASPCLTRAPQQSDVSQSVVLPLVLGLADTCMFTIMYCG